VNNVTVLTCLETRIRTPEVMLASAVGFGRGVSTRYGALSVRTVAASGNAGSAQMSRYFLDRVARVGV
jgi:hypothetical protein